MLAEWFIRAAVQPISHLDEVMRLIPRIDAPQKSHDFHDSTLYSIELSRDLSQVNCVLGVPDGDNNYAAWLVKFYGVLRFEFETLGIGSSQPFPLEIYDVYILENSSETIRWQERFRSLEDEGPLGTIYHVVLASSFAQGWGQNDELDGISIICQGWDIEPTIIDDTEVFISPIIEGPPSKIG